MRQAFDLYHAQTPRAALLAKAGISQGTLSAYLNEIEAATNCRIIRRRSRRSETSADSDGVLTADRENGQRRASIRGFHSFRVTWVTLALSAGVPLEIVQKVTGHRTTEIVLKHYFQPGRESFRKTLESAMPSLLTEGAKSPLDEAREIVEKMTARTLKKDKARLLELLG